jgi:hypothetical protein
MAIECVLWDIDNVWYSGMSRTHAANGSKADYRPHLERFVEKRGLFTYSDVQYWEETTGRKVDSIGTLADMLTDFLYSMKDRIYPNIGVEEAKQLTIEAKQEILHGMTMREIRRIADAVPYTEGLREAVRTLFEARINQYGFSDGLAPFVVYKMQKQRVDIGGIVPTAVEIVGQERLFDTGTLEMLYDDNAQLTGQVGEFDKIQVIRSFLKDSGYKEESTAAIDDSGTNLPTLTRIRDSDGIAIGYNPTKQDTPKFAEAKIPVLRGDLRRFAELVIDRRKIKQYCETWGVQI